MDRLFVSISFLTSAVFISHAQQSNGNVCQMVLDCYADADKALQSCQPPINDQNSLNVKQKQNKNGTKHDECDLRDLQTQVEAKVKIQRKNYVDCVQSRLGLSYDTTVLMKPQDGQLKKCQTAIQKYLSPPNNTSSVRVKRQAPHTENDVSDNPPASTTLFIPDNGNGPTPGPSSTAAASMSDSGINDASITTLGPNNAKDKGKGKGNKGKNGQGKGDNNHKIIEQCKKHANNKMQRCKDLSECCSENNICNLSFELSDLHDQIRGLQRDIAVKRHDCDAIKVAKLSSSSTDTTQIPSHDVPLSPTEPYEKSIH